MAKRAETPAKPVDTAVKTETPSSEIATETATETKDVATIAEGGAVGAALDLSEYFQGHANSGMEKVTSKDVLIPRVGIIQKMSDQVNKNHSAYIEGVEIGMICDLSTGEIIDPPMHFLPVVWDKVWLEWYPRKSGKGLAAIHPTDDILTQTKPNEKNQPTLPNGNYVAETAQFYGLNLSAGRRPSFIPMTSTQLKKSRRWITLAKGERQINPNGEEYIPPLFFRSYLLSTANESNTEGDWEGWVIQRGLSLPELPNWKNIFRQAVEFRESIAASISRGDLTNMTDDVTTIDAKAEESGHDPNEPPPHEGRM
jgi:hypothetical protein